MPDSFQRGTMAVGAYRRQAAAIMLADASRYHLTEATIAGKAASRHLVELASQAGISREQSRRLRCLASAALMAAEGAERLLLELAGE